MVTNLLSSVGIGIDTFSLADLEGFPYDEYMENLSKYEEMERWITGDALDATQTTSSGKEVELYPLKINPLIGTVLKHAYALFGEYEDDGRPLVVPKLVPFKKNEQALEDVYFAEEVLNYLWWENHGRALMMENAILSQIYGGCVFKSSWTPWEARKNGGHREIPFKLERINPKRFYGVPSAGDNFRLAEAWFIKTISAKEARRWGLETDSDDDSDKWLVEYWNRETYKITINGQLARQKVGVEVFDLGGANPFKRVPGHYIPHIRVGNFLGINIIDHLKGLVKEMNLRMGDFGDAVNDDAHSYVAMANSNAPSVKNYGPGLNVFDLGTNKGLTGNEADPTAYELRKQGRASEAMSALNSDLLAQYRRDSFVPAVADGEDEGSQRSALTLATRFWPLHAHIRTERVFWTSAMDVMQSDLLQMMNIKNVGGIKKQHLGMRMKQKWAAVLPRDREGLINEWVQRMSSDLGAPTTFMEQAGDIDDPEAEVQRVLDFKEKVAKIEAEIEMEKAKATANARQNGDNTGQTDNTGSPQD